jgi:hypothetical protein
MANINIFNELLNRITVLEEIKMGEILQIGALCALGTYQLIDGLTNELSNQKSNYHSLPDNLKSYGQEILSLCYSPDALIQMTKRYGLTGAAQTMFEEHIKSEKNYQSRLSGGIQLMSMVYCSLFSKQQIEEQPHHKEILKALQGLELETLIIDKAIDKPEEVKDLDFRALNCRVLYTGITDQFIETISKTHLPPEKKIEIIKDWNNTLGHIYSGQAIDLTKTRTGAIPLNEYIHMIKQTTAKFVQLSAKLGAKIAEKPAEEEQLISNYGLNIGIAFQIRDDWEDMENDIYECKSRAFMITEAINLLPRHEAEFIKKDYAKKPKEIIELIKKSKIPNYVRELNHKYLDQASEEIKNISGLDIKKRLEDIVKILEI